nr:MAE_28990/MAE_18760 family HEPN-like nuclease [Oscillochloris trichoides]
MSDFVQLFNERLQEIEAYLDLLAALEQQVQQGPPSIGRTGPVITVQQQKILYSSVYLQLYNLVESTVSRCIEAFSNAVIERGPWYPSDLSTNLRREWVRCTARTHTELNYENRLAAAFELCEHLVQSLPISTFRIEKGGGGNWDDNSIQDISSRLGLVLRINQDIYRSIKRPFRNDQGSLVFIKNLRNELAHGSLSFAECGEGVTVSDLRELKERTASYLNEVVQFFQKSIDDYEFLLPDRRPSHPSISA